jgi:hypothetical protein
MSRARTFYNCQNLLFDFDRTLNRLDASHFAQSAIRADNYSPRPLRSVVDLYFTGGKSLCVDG